MFDNRIAKLRSGESDTNIDNSIDAISKELLRLDNELGSIEESHHMKIIDTLAVQAHQLNNLQHKFMVRLVRVVDRYMDMLVKLEQRKKEADQKFKDFDKETKKKLRDIKKDFAGTDNHKAIMHEYKDAKKKHEDYSKKIKEVENTIKQIKDIIRDICKRNAYDSKEVHKHSWI